MFDALKGADDRLAMSTLYDGELSDIGSTNAQLVLKAANGDDLSGAAGSQLGAETTEQSIQVVLDALSRPHMPKVEAVGYRVVHPGAKLDSQVRVTAEVLDDLQAAVEFAPLHDPAAISLIRQGMKRFPSVGHYACFDTIFHQTMPEEATTYPIPKALREQGARRYGFHGLSLESVVRQLRGEHNELPRRMVIAHLGSGSSVTALVDGHSVDTTMGLTPDGGVVMGTRPGDLDPGLVLYLLRKQKGSREEMASALESMLNHQSGIVALSGLVNDMKLVRKAAAGGNGDASLALKIFTRSVTKAIGGFCWLLGGLDAIVFTGGIGEHDARTREDVLRGLEGMGVSLESERNDIGQGCLRSIGASQSKTKVFVVPSQEDRMIATHVDRMIRADH